MKMLLRLAAALVLLPLLLACGAYVMQSRGTAPPPAGAALRVATHNVHYIWLNRSEGPWSVGDWTERRAALDAAFKALEADIVATQEMESFGGGNSDEVNLARAWLLERNPGYGAAAVGDWRSFPSTQPIFYRRDRLDLTDQGWFFFSETPDVIYSRTFDGSYPAFASWAEFRTEAGTSLRVVNVHFDAGSGSNRIRSAELVAERLAPLLARGTPVLLLGDLNARLGAPTVDILAEAGLTFADVPGATFHFNRGINVFGAIDHVALGPGIALEGGPWVLRERFAGDWPSDHYPVAADITLSRADQPAGAGGIE